MPRSTKILFVVLLGVCFLTWVCVYRRYGTFCLVACGLSFAASAYHDRDFYGKTSHPGCLLMILGVHWLVLGLVPNWLAARAQGQFTACTNNEKNLATALDAYASDNDGFLPDRLEWLVTTEYLKLLPSCPAASQPSYRYLISQQGSRFTLVCQGLHHSRQTEGLDYQPCLARTRPPGQKP